MQLFIRENYADLSTKAAQIIARELLIKPKLVLGLATGSTPIGMYSKLIELQAAGLIDFSQVRTFNLDEYRGLSAENPQSYHYFMHEKLFDHVPLKAENIHLLKGDTKDLEGEIKKYEQAIKDAGGIDLQVLGIGANGHIGFNEPGTAFEQTTALVGLTEKTISDNARFFSTIDEVPREAISMGLKTIMQAKKVLLLATGEAKANAIKAALYGPITTNVPASILQLHPDLTVVIDTSAAKELTCSAF